MQLYPGLSSKPWYVASEFPAARALEENFEAIRDEALAIDRMAFHSETDPIRREGSWDVFFLYELGLKRDENCALCPVTTRIVEEQPTMRTLTGLIYFSRMGPGTHVRPHRGITNLRVRCHLGIRIPAGDCALRVGTETRQWQGGRAMVFDDYYEHEVWNRTAEDRIVLIVDLWHPDLTPREIAVLEGMQRYAFHHARSLSAYWAGNAAARRELA
jgi:aspartate beta-hydroxylase